MYSQSQIKHAYYDTLVNIKSASGMRNNICCLCEETNTVYEYISAGSSYVANDKEVLTTSAGGDTRWVGISGQYIHYNNTISGLESTNVKAATDELALDVLIQDYTTVSTIGTVGQRQALRDWTVAEFTARFGAGALKAYYRHAAGAMTTDEINAYALTAAGVAPVNTTGPVGTNFAATSPATGYYTQDTLLDDMTSTYSGAGKGLVIGGLFKFTEGRPVAEQVIFDKYKNATNRLFMWLTPSGNIAYQLNANSASEVFNFSIPFIPSGASSWYFILFEQNTTDGITLSIDSNIVARNPLATTLMVDSTDQNFSLRAEYNGNSKLNGRNANCFVMNKILTQADRDWLYAMSIDIPLSLQSRNFTPKGKYKESGLDTNIRTFEPNIIAVDSTRLLMSAGGFKSTDSFKLWGRK